jgi:DNA-binding NarL/FixJ family response regulator
VALADLLAGIPEEVLSALPEPQREALGVALRRTDSGEPDRVALARGALDAIRRAASTRPTVVAIDDAQWLDAPSRDALRFAFRRLVGDERVGLLATVRDNIAGLPLEIDAALPAGRVTRLVLRPLPIAELEDVVRSHARISLPLPSWRAVHRASGGNPFFALQIAEAVAAKGGLAPGEQPPMPISITAAARERLAPLSADARRTILYAASLGKPTATMLRAANGEAGLLEALDARVLEIEGDRIRFSHPLLATAVYTEASPDERCEAHRLLSEFVTEPEEQALHLGRGREAPDATVAETLETAADRAARRGVPETAAELAGHAERLTPPARAEDSARRALQAARYIARGGDGERAIGILRALATSAPAGQTRAGALALLGFMLQDRPTLLRAVEEAAGDPCLLSIVHTDVSTIELRRGDRASAEAHARSAVAAAMASGDDAILVEALTAQALPDAYGRAEGALSLLGRAAELERSLREPTSLINSPSTWCGAVLLDADRFDEAREALESVYQRGLALGHTSRTVPLIFLVELECRTGNWNRALTYVLEAEDLWGKRGWGWTQGARAFVEARLGNAAAARAAGALCLELVRDWDVITLARTEAALGLLELSLGRFEDALDRLRPLANLPDGEPLRDAAAFRGSADAVEALLGLGRVEEAEALVASLEQRAQQTGLPSWVAAASRSRALVLAEEGDQASARAALRDAAAVHEHHREPFEHARTMLAAGSIERRAKQKAEARDRLEQARTTFEQLGARRWAERARLELDRTGLRRATSGELTAAEQQVADLAAGGATNKEIAAELFMSVKTVEAHLSRVYRKLGVRSRTQLASDSNPR